MKSDKRHQLETNTLADTLGEGLKEHGDRLKLLAAGAIALLAIIFAVLYITEQNSNRAASNWTTYFIAVNSPDRGLALETVATDLDERNLGDSGPGLWSKQSLADLKLAIGSANRFGDRDQALEDLEIAKKNFTSVRNGAQAGSLLNLRATYGLGQVHEVLCEPEEARKYYDLVKTAAGESALGEAAAKSIERVDRLKEQGWFVWFVDKELTPPEPVDPNLPTSLDELPGRPNLDFQISPEPDFDAPAVDEPDEKPADEKPADEKPADEKPADEKPADEKPADEKPADEKPADEKPADEKPADEKPADEKPADEKPADE